MVSAGAVALLHRKFDDPADRAAFVLGATAGGALGGRLPDILEPATSPRHRQFCHGIVPCGSAFLTTVGAIVATVDKLLEWAERAPDREQLGPEAIAWVRHARFIIAGFVEGVPVGYASHLLLDSRTPCGLPWIGAIN